MMLFAQCLLVIFQHPMEDSTNIARKEDLERRALIIILQMLERILGLQRPDGLWGEEIPERLESSAFAVLAL